MTCQPRRWVWGFAPLAALWLLAGWFTNDGIEADLTRRAAGAALAAKASWATARIEGRDLTFSGAAPNADARGAAQLAVAAVPGVRLVRDGTTLLAVAKPYLWSVRREGGALTLEGFAPDDETRARIAADARAAVPDGRIVDNMALAAGAPAGFAATTAYALAQLGRLTDGEARLTDAALALSGAAPTQEAYREATSAAPPPHASVDLAVGLPVAAPFVWRAEKQGGSVRLTGFAPSIESKARIAELAAKAAPPGNAVVDDTRLAAGAPTGFDVMAAVALSQLAPLDHGAASLSDAAYALSGAAPSYEVYARVSEAAAKPPQGFASAGVTIAAPIISPYTWSAARAGSTITLEGNAPSEQVKTANAAAARAVAPDMRIVDRQQLNAGAPDGFAAMAANAIGQLGRFSNADARLSDQTFSIYGRTRSVAAMKEAVAAAAALPAGYALSRAEVAAEPVSHYVWSAVRAGSVLTLSGHAPDDATRDALLSAARAAMPGVAVSDSLELAAGAPPGFDVAAAFAIARLAELEDGGATLRDQTLSIGGRAPTVAALNAVSAALRALPAGFSLGRQEISTPRISPYLWSATRNGGTLVLSGHAPDEAAKAAVLAAARAALPDAAVDDRQAIGIGAPEGFAGMAAIALRHLSRLESGVASLTDSAYAITGRAASAVGRDEIAASLLRLPPGFLLARQEIGAPPPPPPPAVVVVPPPPPPAVVIAPTAQTSDDAPPVAVCQTRLDALLTEPILFDKAEATIRPESQALLSRLAAAARGCPQRIIEIGAHTDSDGDEARNQALSERRAQAVVETLTREGAPAAALKAIGYGQAKPIVANDTAENKQKNRRVEFTVR